MSARVRARLAATSEGHPRPASGKHENTHPLQLVRRARRKLDVKLDAGWRSFRTQRGTVPGTQHVHFNPPADLRFAVLRPSAAEVRSAMRANPAPYEPHEPKR